jgi:hypothetical protein
MRTDSYTCDVCEKATKQESNNWWLVQVDLVQPKGAETEHRAFLITPWHDDRAKRTDVKHVCGEGCLQKAIVGFAADIYKGNSGPEWELLHNLLVPRS